MARIGFDVGGSSIKAGVIDDNARVLARSSAPFPTGGDVGAIAGRMRGLADKLLREKGLLPAEIGFIGVAVPGSIDRSGRIVKRAYNLNLHDAPLMDALEEAFPSVLLALENDANAAALAELCAGALQGCRTALLLTIGTGVGGGLILGGRMYPGGMHNGVEIGHMIFNAGGEPCTCGNRGCIESVCTAAHLIREGRRAVLAFPASGIAIAAKQDPGAVDARLLIDCAKAGDVVARRIFDRFLDALAAAVSGLIAALEPERVAIGGGVSEAGDYFFDGLRARIAPQKSALLVVPACMGNSAGIVGAAMLKEGCCTNGK